MDSFTKQVDLHDSRPGGIPAMPGRVIRGEDLWKALEFVRRLPMASSWDADQVIREAEKILSWVSKD